MKQPCGIIRDLLPLYHDGVCSAESRAAVEEHLAECSECAEYDRKLSEALPDLARPDTELRKVNSLKAVRRHITRGKIISSVISAVFVICVLTAGFFILSIECPIKCKNGDITVTMRDEGLIAEVRGTFWSGGRGKRVTAELDGGTRELYFFCLNERIRDALFASASTTCEYTVSYSGKGAETIDMVYYYSGDYTDLEVLAPEELSAVIESSVLLWEKSSQT